MPNMLALRKLVADLSSILLLTLLLCASGSAQNDKKATYDILIDNTGSMRTQFPEVLMLGEEIVDHIPEQSVASICNFKTGPSRKSPFAVITSGVDWSPNKNLLKRYVSRLFIVPGQTTLLDAISSMALELNTRVISDGDPATEKVMFLITDGEERASKIKEKQLIQELKDWDIKVNIFGMVKELDSAGGLTGKSHKDKAVDLLGRIAKETGGRAVFSRSKKDDTLKLLNEMFEPNKLLQNKQPL
jgi:hypothetical protein